MSKGGGERLALEFLKAREEVKGACIVYGEYDILVKLEASDMNKLNDFILNIIRPLQDIEKTTTLIVAGN
jgi:anthranilate phosphoribosyltransferase